ncbi:hypothetical protein T265_07534, partial [Opisthorchis viverrini]
WLKLFKRLRAAESATVSGRLLLTPCLDNSTINVCESAGNLIYEDPRTAIFRTRGIIGPQMCCNTFCLENYSMTRRRP